MSPSAWHAQRVESFRAESHRQARLAVKHKREGRPVLARIAFREARWAGESARRLAAMGPPASALKKYIALSDSVGYGTVSTQEIDDA